MAKKTTRRQGPGKASERTIAIRRSDREKARETGLLGTSKYRMSGVTFDSSPGEIDWEAEAEEELLQGLDELEETYDH